MSNEKQVMEGVKVPFEVALNKAGFGLYNYINAVTAGVVIIAYAFVFHVAPLIVPTSACELETTTAQQGVLAVTTIVGANFGALVWGYLGDTRGRCDMLVASLVTSGIANAIASFSVNWIMLMIILFISSVLSSGIFPLAMTHLGESAPFAKRNIAVLIASSIFLLSQGIMAVIAIPIIPLRFSYHISFLGIYWNSWRTLMVIYSIPCFLTAIWVKLYLQESPSYLFSKGDEEGAIKALKIIYHKNNRKAKEEYDVKGILADKSRQKRRAKDQLFPLFKPPLLKYTIIMTSLMIFDMTSSFMAWLPTVANRFMHSLIESGTGHDLTLCGINNVELPPNPDAIPCNVNSTAMLFVLAVGVIQSFANGILTTFINRVGRRNTTIVLTAFCGLCGVLIELIPNAVASALFFAIFLIGYIVIGIYTAMGVALFPTEVRAMSLAVMLTGSRIGGIAFIQLINYLLVNNCSLAFYIFASITASSALVAAFLPDDRYAKPPELRSLTDNETDGSNDDVAKL